MLGHHRTISHAPLKCHHIKVLFQTLTSRHNTHSNLLSFSGLHVEKDLQQKEFERRPQVPHFCSSGEGILLHMSLIKFTQPLHMLCCYLTALGDCFVGLCTCSDDDMYSMRVLVILSACAEACLSACPSGVPTCPLLVLSPLYRNFLGQSMQYGARVTCLAQHTFVGIYFAPANARVQVLRLKDDLDPLNGSHCCFGDGTGNSSCHQVCDKLLGWVLWRHALLLVWYHKCLLLPAFKVHAIVAQLSSCMVQMHALDVVTDSRNAFEQLFSVRLLTTNTAKGIQRTWAGTQWASAKWQRNA